MSLSTLMNDAGYDSLFFGIYICGIKMIPNKKNSKPSGQVQVKVPSMEWIQLNRNEYCGSQVFEIIMLYLGPAQC